MEYTHVSLLKILGLTPPVSESELKKTYRQLALRYHPDKNPDGKERFIEITAAYEALLSFPDTDDNYQTPTGKCYCVDYFWAAYVRAFQRVPADIRSYFDGRPRTFSLPPPYKDDTRYSLIVQADTPQLGIQKGDFLHIDTGKPAAEGDVILSTQGEIKRFATGDVAFGKVVGFSRVIGELA